MLSLLKYLAVAGFLLLIGDAAWAADCTGYPFPVKPTKCALTGESLNSAIGGRAAKAGDTFSGGVIFQNSLQATGLSPGTPVNYLGLDGAGHFVLNNPAGAGTVTNPLNLTIHAPILGGPNGTTDITSTAAMTNGQVLVGQTGADPLPKTISGDGTLSAGGALSITALAGKNITLSGAVTETGAASGVTLAMPTGGPFTFTFPAATDTLVARTSTDTLTNKTLTSPTVTAPAITGATTIAGGALSGTFTGTPTFSGNLTFSGDPIYTGVPAGTVATGKSLGLDSSNNLVTSSASTGTVTQNGSLTTHAPVIGGTNGSGDIKTLAVLANGQLACGSTASDPVPCNLGAGTGMGVTNGAGSITLNHTGVVTLATGLTSNPGTYNSGAQTLGDGGTLTPQIFMNPVAVDTTLAATDNGKLTWSTASGKTLKVPNPGTSGNPSFLFGNDGSHAYTLTTVGGTATLYGSTHCTGAVTASIPANVSLQTFDDGTNIQCVESTAASVVSGFTTAMVAQVGLSMKGW